MLRVKFYNLIWSWDIGSIFPRIVSKLNSFHLIRYCSLFQCYQLFNISSTSHSFSWFTITGVETTVDFYPVIGSSGAAVSFTTLNTRWSLLLVGKFEPICYWSDLLFYYKGTQTLVWQLSKEACSMNIKCIQVYLVTRLEGGSGNLVLILV